MILGRGTSSKQLIYLLCESKWQKVVTILDGQVK